MTGSDWSVAHVCEAALVGSGHISSYFHMRLRVSNLEVALEPKMNQDEPGVCPFCVRSFLGGRCKLLHAVTHFS